VAWPHDAYSFARASSSDFDDPPQQRGSISMSKQDDNKAVVGRWFTEFRGRSVNLAVV
jgi:hypothetical protein